MCISVYVMDFLGEQILLTVCRKEIEISKVFVLDDIDNCSARDWDGKDYLRIIPRVVW